MELKLLEGLNFQLYCFHPFKPLLGIVKELRLQLEAPSPISGDGTSNGAAATVCDEATCIREATSTLCHGFETDLPLIFAPTVLAIAALVYTIEDAARKNRKCTIRAEAERGVDEAVGSEQVRTCTSGEGHGVTEAHVRLVNLPFLPR